MQPKSVWAPMPRVSLAGLSGGREVEEGGGREEEGRGVG